MKKNHLQNIKKITKRFFQHIADRQWANAHAVIRQIHNSTTTKDEEWKVGYITALQGMLAARRTNQTKHTPFIAQIDESSNIDDLEIFFIEQTQIELNTEFDKGFFQTWYEYSRFIKGE
jgi:hypothetical protein